MQLLHQSCSFSPTVHQVNVPKYSSVDQEKQRYNQKQFDNGGQTKPVFHKKV